MLTRVDVRTRRGTLLQLPLEDFLNGYVVATVDGLDPVKATLVSSGTDFVSARREARNIKLRLELEPDYVTNTVESLRKRLYSYLMPKSEVDLTFIHDDGLEVEITGIVESNDAPLFTKDPAVDVSLMCYESDFIDPDPVSISGTSTSGSTFAPFEYAGNLETGIKLSMTLTRNISALTVYHLTPDGAQHQLDLAGTFLNGDVLELSTVPGEKGAWMTRGGVKTSALYGVPPQSQWLALEEGTNQIRVYVAGTPDIPYTLSYITRYGGL